MCELCWNSDVILDISYIISGVVAAQRHSVVDVLRREWSSSDRSEQPHLVLARLRPPMGWALDTGMCGFYWSRSLYTTEPSTLNIGTCIGAKATTAMTDLPFVLCVSLGMSTLTFPLITGITLALVALG